MSIFELVKSSHSIGECNFHLCFVVAYRKKIFADMRVKELTRAYLLQKAKEMGVVIVAIDFGPDHVHIFISNCGGYSVVHLVKHLKGYSAYMMRKHHYEFFRVWLYGKKFWTRGYFYRSIGSTTTKNVRFYIERSQEKHWKVYSKDGYRRNAQRRLTEFQSKSTGFNQ